LLINTFKNPAIDKKRLASFSGKPFLQSFFIGTNEFQGLKLLFLQYDIIIGPI